MVIVINSTDDFSTNSLSHILLWDFLRTYHTVARKRSCVVHYRIPLYLCIGKRTVLLVSAHLTVRIGTNSLHNQQSQEHHNQVNQLIPSEQIYPPVNHQLTQETNQRYTLSLNCFSIASKRSFIVAIANTANSAASASLRFNAAVTGWSITL